ncbi:aldo/keto reductase [Aquimarina gracilis]|uniref:Aldo/keto reductase n=1 Tax=Aquimarina gracilis TaxID=874422 RepID=A0ABU5ZRZ6_9FLAO|nr:aldo/keto reductase [Aquimarina gracilis]MEB3344803.1 aldo/keto reductase [Aquimarina gracilis]
MKTQKTYKLGNQEINRLGFGTMRATTGPGIWGDTPNKSDAIKVIRTAIENGVNFIDTADAYGPYTSELLVKEAIEPFKNEVVIATKGGAVKYKPGAVMANGHPYYLRTAVEGSLRRLNRETIDLYFLHRVDPTIPIEESVGALADMQKQGMIKQIGISNVTVEQVKRAQTVAKIDAVQNAFNFQDRRYEDVVKLTAKENIAFVAHTPIAVNNWNHEIVSQSTEGLSINQLSLSWLLGFEENVIPIPGTSSLEHLKENLMVNDLYVHPDNF